MILGKRICVVMPAYNAATTLERTFGELDPTVVDRVLLVDDASADETVEVARRLGIETHIPNRLFATVVGTEPGLEVLKSIDIILREVANLKRIGEEFSKQEAGTLSIATTHTQARYVLPGPVAQLRHLQSGGGGILGLCGNFGGGGTIICYWIVMLGLVDRGVVLT